MTIGIDPTSVGGRSPQIERHVPLVVVGAGPAGTAAATAAARAGLEVLLVDEHPLDFDLMAMDVPLYFGQRMSEVVRDRGAMLERVIQTNPALEEAIEAGVDVQLGVTAWGAFRPGPTVRNLGSPVIGLADPGRSWLVGCDRLVVATGARDLGVAFRGWEKPGTMGALGALALIGRYQALVAGRLVVLGSGSLGLRAAAAALGAGVEVAAVVEVLPDVQGDPSLREALERRGVAFYVGHTVKEALGRRDGVEALVLAPLDHDLRPRPGRETEVACDTVCLALGRVPSVELLQVLGCQLAFRSERGGFVPELDESLRTSVTEVLVAGDAAGLGDDDVADPGWAAAEGQRAGLVAARDLGATTASVQAPTSPTTPRAGARSRVHDYWRRWAQALGQAGGEDTIVCQCEEVTRRELVGVQPPRYLAWRSAPMSARSLDTLQRDGPVNPDQVKRLTRAGMGPCQGRRCREQVALLLGEAAGVPMEAVPLASYRPPVRPLPLSVLWPHEEPVEMRRHWVSWFGIPTMFAPHWTGDPVLTAEDPNGVPGVAADK
jgi:thioredoxin reductase